MTVLVLIGGDNREREVSLRSSDEVIKALKLLGHEVIAYDTKNGYEGFPTAAKGADIALPIIHGRGGEDGEVQAELEKIGIKYLGADVEVSKLCCDKVAFKSAVQKLGVKVPKGEIVDQNSFAQSELSQKPYVLKPIDDGSSVDTFIVRDPSTQKPPVSIFDSRERMLLEELITGTEITIPILGNSALPVVEIIPPEGGEFDYENKYNGASQEISPPKNVDMDKQQEAQRLSEKIHTGLGVGHLSRTDMILAPDGALFVLELNTIPGLTPQSLYPKGAKAAGLSFKDVVERFVELVLGGK